MTAGASQAGAATTAAGADGLAVDCAHAVAAAYAATVLAAIDSYTAAIGARVVPAAGVAATGAAEAPPHPPSPPSRHYFLSAAPQRRRDDAV